MIGSLLVTITAILWLMRRLLTLYQLPLSQAIKALSVNVPKIPKISIDKITKEAVALHWDNPYSGEEKDPRCSDSISSYALYLNGIQLQTFDNSSRSCVLQGLLPNSLYKVEIVAFDVMNFRSKSFPAFIKTRVSTERFVEQNEDPNDLIALLIKSHDAKGDFKLHRAFPATSKKPLLDEHDETSPEHGGKPKTIADLRLMLECGQEDLRSLLQQQQQAETDYRDQMEILELNRNEIRNRKKREDDNRANVKTEMKNLEESLRIAESIKLKKQRRLKEKIESVAQKKAEMEEWQQDLRKMEERISDLNVNEEDVICSLDSTAYALKKGCSSLTRDIASSEDQHKNEAANRRCLDLLRQQLVPLFQDLSSSTDPETGILGAEGSKALNKLADLNPQWKFEVELEMIEDAKADAQWRANLLKENQRCHNSRYQYHALMAEHEKLSKLKEQHEEEENMKMLHRTYNTFPSVESGDYNFSRNPSNSGKFSLWSNSSHNVGAGFAEDGKLTQSVINVAGLTNGAQMNQSTSQPLSLMSSPSFASNAYLYPQRQPVQPKSTDTSSLDPTEQGVPFAMDLRNGLVSSSSPPNQSIMQSSFMMNNDHAGLQPISSASSTANSPLPTHRPPIKEQPSSPFSPRRLSSVFGFSHKSQPENTDPSSTFSTDSKFLNILRRNNHPPDNPPEPAAQYSGAPLDIRHRSGSFGSSIWSNAKPTTKRDPLTWNLFGSPAGSLDGLHSSVTPQFGSHVQPLFNEPYIPESSASTMNVADQPQIVVEDEDMDLREPREVCTPSVDYENPPLSPSFFKKKIFPFGTSPTKTKTKESERSVSTDDLDKEMQDEIHNMSSSAGTAHSKSSRFFSKIGRRNSQSTSQNSASSAMSTFSSSEGNSKFGKRLNFLAKKSNKDETGSAEE